jgi:hypothetical protein
MHFIQFGHLFWSHSTWTDSNFHGREIPLCQSVCILLLFSLSLSLSLFLELSTLRNWEQRFNFVSFVCFLFCFLRHDVTAEGTIQFNEWVSPISQDSWMFKAPLVKPLATYEMNIDFPFGFPGCDNRVAYEFKHAGFHVINPCTTQLLYFSHVFKTFVFPSLLFQTSQWTLKLNHTLLLMFVRFSGLKIICRHLHISQKRNYTQENRIEGQYSACTPSADM